jgi:L,D-transpeptidase YcbB
MRSLLQRIAFFGALAVIQGAAGGPAGAKDDFPPKAVAQPTPEIDAPGLDAISPSNGKTQNEQPSTALPPEETLPRVAQERGKAEDVPAATTTGGAILPPATGENEGAAPPEPLPAVNATLKFVLEARLGVPDPLGLHRREREAISAFYMARGFAPLWWNAGAPTAEAKAVALRLKQARDDGLDLKGFAPAFSPSSDREVAAADIALTDAVVAYGRQASGSRVDPHMISRLIGAEPEVADPALILALVSTAGASAGDELRKFNPPQKGYLALRQKLAEMRRGHRVAGGDPRAPLAQARSSLEGRSEAQTEANGKELSGDAAFAGVQKANGIKPSSKFAARAAAVSSAGETARLEAEIIANMEIWRWMPRDLGERRVEVNIPDFEAAVIDHGEVVERTRVIVGKEETPTPVFSETMRFLIVNPYWNVPPSILRKEMLPKAAGDPTYFRRLGYEVFTRAGHLVVRQPPGERNALGRIKFMFPNDFSVYMHDTPMRRLFAAQKRAFSHGCVRVDEPFRFAETVLGRANGWSEERVKKLIGGRERYVYLPKPLPVHIEYFTAYVDEDGALRLRSDLYGYSRKVRQALGLEG